MNDDKMENIIVKFLDKIASVEELKQLEDWIQDPSNEKMFNEYVKTHYAINLGMNDPKVNYAKRQLLKEMRASKGRIYNNRFVALLKYAAIAVIGIGIGYYLQNNAQNENKVVVLQEDAITLELEDGNVKVISLDGASKVVDAKGNVLGVQDGNKLMYDTDAKTEKLTYNTLNIPYGKRFDIVLSDGTTVFLNSGSSLKYPVNFIAGQNRQVYLDGEAFFEVTEDKKHPFIVDAQEINVEVLGTKFNVSSYQNDTRIDVVLVEGSVSMDSKEKNTSTNSLVVLEPGFNGSFNKKQKVISTEKVNTSLYTSWRTGIMTFRDQPFREIVRKLERVYDVSILIENSSIANERFNASIETDIESIADVLGYFNKLYEIEYEITEDGILIK
ncbi:MAG: FecR domain-containing protein [Bacteroidota bacterium]